MNDAMLVLSALSLCSNRGSSEFTSAPGPYNAYLTKLTKAAKTNLCSVSELIEQTSEILSMMQNYSITPDETTCTCLLTVYVATQDMDAAEHLVFSDEKQESLIKQWGLSVNIKIYNALLGVCASTGRGDITQKILLRLDGNARKRNPNKRILPNETTCICLLTAYKATQNMDAAELLVFSDYRQKSYLRQWGLSVNINIYGALLGVCASTGRGDIAKKILRRLDENYMAEKPDKRILPNETICICLLTVYAAIQYMDAAVRLVFSDYRQESYLRQWILKVDIKIYNALLGVCASTGRGDITQKILLRLDGNAKKQNPNKRILPNETTCICLLTAYEAIQDMDAAELLVFGDYRQESYLRQWRLSVNTKIYGALLGVCASTGRGDIAKKILRRLDENFMAEKPDKRILPNETICICLLIVYAAIQDMDAAERLVFGYDKQESYLNRWKVTPSYLIYAHWALVGADKVSDKIAILCKKNICLSELGLNNGSFNCHVGAIFNTKNKEAFKGVPFKFALALYRYHSQKTTITEVITGYHLGHTLRSQFMQFLKEVCKKEVKVHQSNPGALIL